VTIENAKPAKPRPGWWAVQHNIGMDRNLSLLPDDKVLACLGLMVAATGFSIGFETPIVTLADLTRHGIVGAASTETILDAVQHLTDAGIWVEIPGVGYDCGATEYIDAKIDRIKKAQAAVEARLAKRAKFLADAALREEGGE
jgi:hypothetical protein